MKNSDLDKILKSAVVPERPAEYWRQFPQKVMRRTGLLGGGVDARSLPGLSARCAKWASAFHTKWAAPAFGLALACAAVVLTIHFSRSQPKVSDEVPIAGVKKYYREIESLFPGQLRAIIFDQEGLHLVLSDRADVPVSQPIYLKICGRSGCQGFVTFSGQQIIVNGELCDVLLSRHGEVILCGPQVFWSTGASAEKTGNYKIEAKSLGAAS